MLKVAGLLFTFESKEDFSVWRIKVLDVSLRNVDTPWV
jgi:hypothetical protein